MATSQQQLPNDSFSHGWLISVKPPFDFLGDSQRSFDGACSFIEMDPHLLSMRWSSGQHADVDGADFDFGDLPRTSLPSQLANADQIFYDGHLLPFAAVSTPPPFDAAAVGFIDPPTVGKSARPNSSKSLLSRSHTTASCFDSVPSRTTSCASSPAFHSAHSTPSSSPSSCKGIASSGKSPLVGNLCAKSPRKLLFKYLLFLIPLLKKIKGLRMTSAKPERSSKVSARSSPRTSSSFSSMEWCRSNADISISDAILYCKRSNDKDIK